MMRNLITSGCVMIAIAGCVAGSACERSCEEAQDCGSAVEDCTAECAELEEFGQASGCDGVFDDLFLCYEANDVCSPSIIENCSEEITAALSCQIEFCVSNPNDPVCQSEG